MKTRCAPLTVILLILAVTVLLAGCGGGGEIDDDNGYDPDDPYYPQYKDLTLILRVQQPGGWPIGGATVIIDGEADTQRTDAELHPLGSGYPYAWLGWKCNWVSDDYQVVMNYEGDQDAFEIRVHKDGYVDDSTIVRIYDEEPSHIFIRDKMILYPITSGREAKRAPHYAEVAGGDAPLKLQQGGKPLKLIKSTDDRGNGGQ